MKKWMKVVLVIAVMSVIFLAGCKDDTTDPELSEFEILTQYMEDNNLDLPAMLTDSYILADVLEASLLDYFIIDIRNGDKYGPDSLGTWPGANGIPDFDDGHIDGAHSVALADVVTYELANNVDDLPVVVACYTGHDAGHAVMALRLSGVTTAKSLKWGMSKWNVDFDLWTGHTGNEADNYPGSWIEDDEIPELPNYTDVPSISTSLEDGAEILADQIANKVLDGLNGITNADVLPNYDAYDIYNYWAVADWELYGHIMTSYQLTPGNLSIETLDMINPDGVNVIYCWSGQTASFVAAWLNVLGYDGRTLKFGANEMIYDTLQGHKWAGSADYDYIPTP